MDRIVYKFSLRVLKFGGRVLFWIKKIIRKFWRLEENVEYE